jgi:hypothetical protein
MMNRTNSLLAGSILLVLLLTGLASAQTDRSLLLVVNNGHGEWLDGNLREQLVDILCDRTGLTLIAPDKAEELLQRLGGKFDRQSVVKEGRAEKYRYILWCDIRKQRLSIDNGFSLPILMTQKQVKATMELDYHIIDCNRGRSVSSSRLTVHETGPATLQFVSFSDADPSLLLSYPEKKALFDRLEEQAAGKLAAVFDEVARQR